MDREQPWGERLEVLLNEKLNIICHCTHSSESQLCLGCIKNSLGQPCLSREVEPDNSLLSFPTLRILWFHDFRLNCRAGMQLNRSFIRPSKDTLKDEDSATSLFESFVPYLQLEALHIYAISAGLLHFYFFLSLLPCNVSMHQAKIPSVIGTREQLLHLLGQGVGLDDLQIQVPSKLGHPSMW